MVKSNIKDVAKNICGHLFNHAKQQSENFSTLMAQYVLQRFLYRLSISRYHTDNDEMIIKKSSNSLLIFVTINM